MHPFSVFIENSWAIASLDHAVKEGNSEIKKWWYEGELHEKLCNRRKGQHLSAEYKAYLYQLLWNFPENHKSIRVAYKLSTATYSKLNSNKNSRLGLEEFDITMNLMCTPISAGAQKFIAKILEPPKPPTTISEIKTAIYDELGEMYSMHFIKNYLKKVLKYSFKKAWSRPPKYARPEIKRAKGLFWAELLRIINKQQPIFNIDEWRFTRAVKSEYSWLPSGKSSFVINDVWRESVSLIMAAGSTGQWFGVIKHGTIDAHTFWIFLGLFKKLLMETRSTSQKLPVLILDNASIHTSNFTKTAINLLNLKVKQLPPYCPEVAPVEHVFRAIKSKLRNRSSTKAIDFNKLSGIETLKDATEEISKNTWKNVWSEVIRECLEGIKSTAKEFANNN